MTQEQIDIIVRRYQQDASVAEIAEEIGVSLATLKRWVKENRISYHMPYRKKSSQYKEQKPDPDILESSWNVHLGLKYITTEWTSDEVSQS